MSDSFSLAAEYATACAKRSIKPDDHLISQLQTASPDIHLTAEPHLTLLLHLFATLPPTYTCCFPTSLTISDASLPAAAIGTLATYLTTQNHLTRLCIERSRLPDAGVETLLTALTPVAAASSPLTHVRLADVGLSPHAAIALAPLLARPLGGLVDLDLSNNNANASGVRALETAQEIRATTSGNPLTLNTSGNLVTIETLNALTHGLGALFAFVAGVRLTLAALHKPLDNAGVGSIVTFCTALFILLASSCAYHCVFRHPALHAFLRRADHCSIFLLIAGSYTPFVVAYAMRPPTITGILTLTAVWACAVAGVVRSVLGLGSSRTRALFALATGWVGVISVRTMLANMPKGALFSVVAGGIVYSVGIVFYLLGRKRPLMHVIWHFAVMIGGAFHYYALMKYVVGGD